MKLPPYSYSADWDIYNKEHIARHKLSDYQIEELYYGEGIYPTLVVKNKKNESGEQRLKLIGVDASGTFIKAIIAIDFKNKKWRCVTAIKMNNNEKYSYLKHIGAK